MEEGLAVWRSDEATTRARIIGKRAMRRSHSGVRDFKCDLMVEEKERKGGNESGGGETKRRRADYASTTRRLGEPYSCSLH